MRRPSPARSCSRERSKVSVLAAMRSRVDHAPVRSMVLDRPGTPLRPAQLPEPRPGPGQVALRVRACGVCRTDLHLTDGEVEAGHLPLVLGHQIVGTTDDGRRAGVPWLGWPRHTRRAL